uniref:Reverse transcriptase domain-containing protein n=1 Tax=Tanacetum cinerariifolium TaxID=118510 RepID=A0A699HSQ7_TANCI|nr:reverse transcriptase domain-containing protein [Tanacetum cinerariifolium]
MQAYDVTDNELPIPPQAPTAPPTIFPPSPVLSLSPIMAPKRTSTSAAPAMTQAAICNSTEDCKVKFATSTLTKDALSWWNSYAKPTEIKRLLTNKYYPQTKVRKIEDEFYNLVVKGNDLKTYARRFQELETLCPNMVPNNKKLIEVFIEGLPQSIEGTVTASKPQTLEEAINISQMLLN